MRSLIFFFYFFIFLTVAIVAVAIAFAVAVFGGDVAGCIMNVFFLLEIMTTCCTNCCCLYSFRFYLPVLFFIGWFGWQFLVAIKIRISGAGCVNRGERIKCRGSILFEEILLV